MWRPADVETTGVLAIETAGQRDGSAVPLVAEVLKYAEVLHVNGDLKLTFKDRVFAALLGRFRFATRTPLSLALQGDRVTMVSQAGTVDFVPVFPKWWPRRQLGVMAPK